MKIALTGGIACGKSTLAKFLRELGIRLLDADDVVHELEGVNGAAVPEIIARFGSEILAPDGSIDRAKLASIVFTPRSGREVRREQAANPRTDLESILFPLVRTRLLDFVSFHSPTTSQLLNLSTSSIRIAVIPLLFESHWESDYDIIIAIVSPEEVQIDRMMRTRGYTREQAEARLAAQMPVAEKAARADFVVVNDSTEEHLMNEARRLHAWLEEKISYEH